MLPNIAGKNLTPLTPLSSRGEGEEFVPSLLRGGVGGGVVAQRIAIAVKPTLGFRASSFLPLPGTHIILEATI
ncbi:hypothetical protein [Argonema galeatum]|uniref:hypothetical protein n=1 Tax=Argonema galeatum TaxID=2942762 RepID=UPI00201148A5|nr:hypothetical protein [Argonema galeatum]MCL1466023.1 hypothetical protein [Argonema galeatum A003/A1]